MLISWESLRSKAFGDITTDKKRQAILAWLQDRWEFHKWFASIITGSFVAFALFGEAAEFNYLRQVSILTGHVLFLFALLGNLVILWSIPSWKIMITLEEINNCSRMRWDYRLTTWFSIICFLAGLVLAMAGNIPT
jgi:hypothetical protein